MGGLSDKGPGYENPDEYFEYHAAIRRTEDGPDDSAHRTGYAGSVSRGLWKTTDAGASWQSLTDHLPNLAVTALAMPASNPDIIYMGTGEGFRNHDFGAEQRLGEGQILTEFSQVQVSLIRDRGTNAEYLLPSKARECGSIMLSDKRSHDRLSSSSRERPHSWISHGVEILGIPSQKGKPWCSLFPKIPLQCLCGRGDRRSQD